MFPSSTKFVSVVAMQEEDFPSIYKEETSSSPKFQDLSQRSGYGLQAELTRTFIKVNTFCRIRRILFLLLIIIVGLVFSSSTKATIDFENPDLLLNDIARNHLTPPADQAIPYNLSVAFKSWDAQDNYNKELINIIFHNREFKRGGFFVEAGALDGQHLSHTLDLERFYGWSGLLVEASPSMVPQLRSKNRKSWIADVCLTEKPYRKLEFMTLKNQTTQLWHRAVGKLANEPKLEDGDQIENYRSEGQVECYPLYSLLKAIPNGPKVVDLLVLDVEGEEFKILESYPFSLLPIKVVAVEHWHTPEGSENMKQLMSQKGYRLVYSSRSDFVFLLNSPLGLE